MITTFVVILSFKFDYLLLFFQLINEESLKTLHEYVASLHGHRHHALQPVDLIFYIRNTNNSKGNIGHTCFVIVANHLLLHCVVNVLFYSYECI